ncbi:MAG: hypothetical protein BGO34_16970 [Bacteroidia bacterium 44-10]|nr:MAG: hypothetical protein BGO34_16970 [Bacteroidia bacterium 44-10]
MKALISTISHKPGRYTTETEKMPHRKDSSAIRAKEPSDRNHKANPEKGPIEKVCKRIYVKS